MSWGRRKKPRRPGCPKGIKNTRKQKPVSKVKLVPAYSKDELAMMHPLASGYVIRTGKKAPTPPESGGPIVGSVPVPEKRRAWSWYPKNSDTID